jgi:hypothetical protein
MSLTDELLENNKKYAAGFTGPLQLPPTKQVAVLSPAWRPGSTCTASVLMTWSRPMISRSPRSRST